MKKLLLLFAVSILIFPSCKVIDLFKKNKEKEPEEIRKSYEIKVPVTTLTATKTDLVKYIKINGIAESKSNIIIYSEISGTLSNLNIRENEIVKEGDILITLATDDLQLQLQTAQITYNKALSEFNAWKTMENAATEEQLKIQTGLSEAEIQLQRINLSIEKSVIKAPFDGVVTKIKVVQGEMISTGKELFTIIDNEDIYVKGQVLESELGRIKEGVNVRLRFAAIPDNIFEGELVSVSPEIDQFNRTCEVIVKLENNGDVKTGMFCEMKIEAEILKDQILIHKDAILVRNGRKLVFAVEGDKAKWQYVEIAAENDRFASISDGVKDGQDIIIEGNFSLAHDALINVKERKDFSTILDKF